MPIAKETNIALWVSELHPDFLKAVYPKIESTHGQINRGAFLEPQFKPEGILKDVRSLTFEIQESRSEDLVECLLALGFEKQSKEGLVELVSDEFSVRMRIVSGDSPVRPASISFQVNDDVTVEPSVQKIGDTLVVHILEDRTGVIEFIDAGGETEAESDGD